MAAKKRVDMSDPQSMYADLRAQIEELRLQLDERAEEEKPQKSKNDGALLGAIHTSGIVQGMQAVFEPLRAAIEREGAKDEKVSQRLDSVDQALQLLTQAVKENKASNDLLRASIEEFTQTLRTPKTRTGVVDLPTGSVKMTITEARGKH